MKKKTVNSNKKISKEFFNDFPLLISRSFHLSRSLIEFHLEVEGLQNYISHGFGPILHSLNVEGKCNISDIVQRSSLAPSTLTPLLKKAIKKGLIKKSSYSPDKRHVLLELTKKGKSLIPIMEKFHLKMLRIIYKDMTKQQIQSLQSLLNIVSNNMKLPNS